MSDPKPCIRCAGPLDGTNRSYCRSCKQVIDIERGYHARSRAKGPRKTCAQCGEIRDGGNYTYCVACCRARRDEWITKPCHQCGAARTEADPGRGTYCSRCSRSVWLLRTYGLTMDDQDRMLADQGGLCAICKCENNGRQWHIDHCHDTGRVRGVLCDRCNRGIGQFCDSPDLLLRAVEYLEAQRA